VAPATGWAVTGVAGSPITSLVTAVLLVFLGGYAAMSLHVINTGAMYAFVSRGLGRVVGVGTALVAVLAYPAMQIGLFSGIGAVAVGFLDHTLGVEAPWWCYVGVAWLLIFTLADGVAGPGLVDAGHALLLTSLFASALAFHNTLTRYMFTLGRDGMLPAMLGLTSSSSPRTGERLDNPQHPGPGCGRSGGALGPNGHRVLLDGHPG